MSTPEHEHHGRAIRHELDIAAAADEVWSAWADPERIAQWFVDRAEGFARKGEVVKWYFDAMKLEVQQPILEAEPGSSFVTGGEHAGRPWLLEVTVQHRGGQTKLRLITSGFSEDDHPGDEDQREGVDSGWLLALHTLEHWLEVHASRGGERTHTLVMQPAPPSFSWAWLTPHFTTMEGLARWLGPAVGPKELTAGSALTVELGPDARLTGTILCRSRREVLSSWPERSAVLALKAFGAGPVNMLALDVSGWGPDAPSSEEVRGFATGALQRLAGL